MFSSLGLILQRSIFMHFILLLLLSPNLLANAAIHEVRLWSSPDKTRLVFDLDKPVAHKIFSLKNPSRVVIDIPAANMDFDTSKLVLKGTPIRLIRSAKKNKTDLRIVLDLDSNVSAGSFLLKKNGDADDRLVLDLKYLKGGVKKPTVVQTAKAQQKKQRNLIIAIDAGHGGEDPGATGPGRVREKRVVYAIAKKLAAKFNQHKGYKAVMIRSGDYYVGLSKRRELARKHNADLFISIHADAFTSPQAHGASVYALSNKGSSSSFAKFLAQRENKSDLFGGVSISDKDHILSSVLLDLSMTYKMDASLDVGKYVLKEMGTFTHLHSKRVGQAAFAVLKTPDIPSLLIETGFISNPKEAKNLNSRVYQQKMADAIFTGVNRYFKAKPLDGTYIAAKYGKKRGKSYIVESGDTLSGIAVRYNVPMKSLRKHNRLSSNSVRIGQVLKIPST
ncbi:MAG: N-acetylmuramoyl-L-alanine amidase [Pseudomonadales bacterium]|nr:N-acetylmuramoyl-L-alanine amidase [Pseudomonadales bacterium]